MGWDAIDWSDVFWWATGLSVVALIATAIGVPWAVARLPSDYFSRDERAVWRGRADAPFAALMLALAKNGLGAVLLVLGMIMLITPGQGLLTILIGLMLLNFPGKYRLERWLVMRPGALRALNWLRRRHGREPFERPRGDGSGNRSENVERS